MKENQYYRALAPIIMAAGIKAKNSWMKFHRTDSTLKSGMEIVTKTDKLTEKAIISGLRRIFPSHAFLGEESGSQKGSSEYTWIIDPIDGTTNFSIHNPLWSISVGLAKAGEIIFGAVYIPIIDEMYWAGKGEGAYLNGKRIILGRNTPSAKKIHTFCHGQNKKNMLRALAYYQKQKLSSLDCRQLGSAAIELCYVASGRVDSLVIPGARSWDVAAGAIIATEAGADVSNFTGRKWTLKEQDILACHPDIKTEILKKLKNI